MGRAVAGVFQPIHQLIHPLIRIWDVAQPGADFGGAVAAADPQPPQADRMRSTDAFSPLSQAFDMSPGNAEASSSSYPFYFDPAAATSSQYRLAVDPTLARDVKPSLDPSLSSFAPPSSNIAYSAPPIGGTRCYWSILSPALDFVFIDPVLHRHLGEDSSKFLGTSLLDYVHPEEVANLRTDLVGDPVTGAGGVASGGVFGSTSRYVPPLVFWSAATLVWVVEGPANAVFWCVGFDTRESRESASCSVATPPTSGRGPIIGRTTRTTSRSRS